MTDKIIRYGNKQFPLEEGMTLEQAKALMARHFPELAEPKVETKKEGKKTVYCFSKQAGRKGAAKPSAHRRAVAALRKLHRSPVVADAVIQACLTRRLADDLDIDDMARELDEAAQHVRRAGDALLALAPTDGAGSELL
jgi:hypothetical protein